MPEQAKKTLVLSIYFALAVSTLLVFWQVRNFDFINYDDNIYVYENPHVLNGLTIDSIVWAFTTGHTGYWHPLTWLSLMLDCQLFGANPGRIHLVNVFLHLANTLLLFAILKKITSTLWPSAFVAAAFALHPMHIQSVAWIAERKDVLSTLFFMLTLLAYYRYTKQQNKGGYFLAILIFAFGLMAKPMLTTLPFVLLLLDYWPLNRFEPQVAKLSGRHYRKFAPSPDKGTILYRRIIEKIPFFVLAGVLSVITFLVQWSSGAVADTTCYPLGSRAVNALASYASYIGKMFWPQNLTVFYPFCIGRSSAWQVALYALLLLGISFFVVRLGRKQKYLPVGWFWFIGTLIPVIGIIQVGDQAMADRYTYIPYIGLFIMIGWSLPQLVAKWPYRKIALGIAMPIVLAALGICAYRQTSYWKNSSTLFTHALEVTSDNYLAHGRLAQDAHLQGNIALAIEHFTKTLQINPNYADAILGLGCALADRGDIAQAVGYIKRSLEIEPDNVGIKNNLAWILATCSDPNIRNPSDAIRIAQEACIATNYAEPGILDTLAVAYASEGRFPEAIETAQKALGLVSWDNVDMARTIQSHLDLYKISKPYIEAPK
jgi:cytochrome c-type biogenesis protein CcmH/NrfG